MSDALPVHNSEEARERRHWRAFWDTIPGWVKNTFLAITAAAGTWGTVQMTKTDPETSRLEERMLKQEVKMENVEKTLDKVDGKLDRLLARRDR